MRPAGGFETAEPKWDQPFRRLLRRCSVLTVNGQPEDPFDIVRNFTSYHASSPSR